MSWSKIKNQYLSIRSAKASPNSIVLVYQRTFLHGTFHIRIGNRCEKLSKITRPSFEQPVASFGQRRLSRSRWAAAFGCRSRTGRAHADWTEFHRVRTRVSELEDFEAFLQWWPVEQLPSARLAGTRIFVRVTPWRWNDCGQRRRLEIVERQDTHPDGCMPHHRSARKGKGNVCGLDMASNEYHPSTAMRGLF